MSQHCSMPLSTFVSYETADKVLSRSSSAGGSARKGTKREEGWAREEQREREREREGEDIIAGGLMRRHNCTIIDDRFIRRPWTASLCSTHRKAPHRHGRILL